MLLHLIKLQVWKWKLERREQKYFGKAIGGIEGSNSPKEVIAANDELRKVREEMQALEMGKIFYLIRKYGLPSPDFDDESLWVTQPSGLRCFSPKGLIEVRSIIRKESRERWQFWELRLKVLGTVLAGLTGAIGALIGLIAVLRH